jgi:hypothetical protein
MSDTEKRIEEIEQEMQGQHFWEDKEKAQKLVKELKELKAGAGGGYDGKGRRHHNFRRRRRRRRRRLCLDAFFHVSKIFKKSRLGHIPYSQKRK